MRGPEEMGRVEFFGIILPARTRQEVGMFPNKSADHIRTVVAGCLNLVSGLQ